MSRSVGPLIAGALLGAALGAAAAWLALGGGEPPELEAAAKEPRGAGRPAAGGADGATSVEPVMVAAPVEVERAVGARGDSAAPTDLIDRVTALARRAPAADARRGDRVLRGRATDARGRPLAGVVIRATRHGDEQPGKPEPSRTGQAAPPAPSLEEAVRSAVESYYEHASDFREATTDADGRYLIAELRPGRYGVEAWREGFRLHDPDGRAGDVRPDVTVDFLAKSVVPVKVDVRLPGGSQAPAAYVWSTERGKGNSESGGWSPAEPTIALPPGEHELRASLGDPNSGPPWPEFLTAEAAKLTVAEGVAPAAVTLTLKGEPGVRGRVRLADGTAPPHAQVRLLAQPSGAPDLKRLAEDPEAKSWWTENGEYLFRELAPGRYVVGMSRDWRNRILAHAVVEVGAGMVTQDLVVPDLDPSTCVVVRATGPDDELLSEVNFQWRVEREKNQWQGDTLPQRKGPGVWWLPLEAVGSNDFDSLKPWPPQTRLFLVAWSGGFGSMGVEVFQGTRSVDLRFAPPATLHVTVPGYVGGPYVGRVNFSLERAGEGIHKLGWGGGGAPGGSDGVAKIGPLQAGRHRLVMTISEKGQQRWNQSEAASMELSLVPGDNHVAMSIPALHSLVVRMPAGSEGRLTLQMIGRTSQRARSAEVPKDGVATFTELPPGEWRLTCMGGASPGVMHVSVPSGGPVDYEPMVVNALRAVVQDGAGQLAAAGFQDGDLVVAVEGKEIASFLDLQLLSTAARMAKSLTLTVQRGAERIPLTVESRWVNDTARLGGSFEPATR